MEITILYIASPSYSGSTLLSRLLNAHSQIISVGEHRVLSSEISRDKLLEERVCTCGAISLRNCDFWKAIDKQLQIDSDFSLQTLDLNIADHDLFRSHNQVFFNAIQAVSGKNLIVDTSKNITRFDRLKCAGFNVVPIRLQRNILGVINSGIKYHQNKNRIAYNYWYYYQRLFEITGPQIAKIEYETLARRPKCELSKLMKYLNLPFENEQLNWAEMQSHYIGGNPMRYQKDNLIQLDEKWKIELDWKTKLKSVGWLLLSKLPPDCQYFIFRNLKKVWKNFK